MLDALCYLVARVDQGKLGLLRRLWQLKDEEPPVPPTEPRPPKRKWLSIHNEALWTQMGSIDMNPPADRWTDMGDFPPRGYGLNPTFLARDGLPRWRRFPL